MSDYIMLTKMFIIFIKIFTFETLLQKARMSVTEVHENSIKRWASLVSRLRINIEAKILDSTSF